MKSRRIITMSAIAIALAACGNKQETPSPAETLKACLTDYVNQGKIMFGHQDSYLYGHSWKVEENATIFDRSDIHDVSGKYPALYGMDLGGIELGSPLNIDKNDFNHMRASAIAHYKRGGVITFSWHPRNPLTGGDTWDNHSTEVVASILPGGEKHEMFMGWLSKAADYLGSFKTEDGEMIPIIFRPWHEHTRDWFWWGQNLCTTEQYKSLWKMTYDYMTADRGLTNLVWAYSPGAGGLDAALFEERYPGDEIVDMVGFDCYQYGDNASYVSDMKAALDITGKFAKDHGKLMAVTETGYEGVKDAKWWTSVLYEAVKDYPVSYVLTWRNACDQPHHYYAPFPGQESADDFREFAALDQMIFCK